MNIWSCIQVKQTGTFSFSLKFFINSITSKVLDLIKTVGGSDDIIKACKVIASPRQHL